MVDNLEYVDVAFFAHNDSENNIMKLGTPRTKQPASWRTPFNNTFSRQVPRTSLHWMTLVY